MTCRINANGQHRSVNGMPCECGAFLDWVEPVCARCLGPWPTAEEKHTCRDGASWGARTWVRARALR